MDFWGVEVKSGEPLVAKPGNDAVIHLSQACLGEVKKDKGNPFVHLYVKVGDQKLVIGKLSGEKFPQTSFDLVFDKDFELSHDWKNGSVYFCGYKSYLEVQSESDDDSDVEEYPTDEELPLVAATEKPESQAKPAAEKATASKSGSTAAKQKVKIVEPKKEDETSTEDDESDDDDSDAQDQVTTNGGGMSDDEEESENGEDESEEEDDDDDESSDEDEETPKKNAEKSKKRPMESSTKTPAPEKKAKFVTPQKTDGKKGVVHVATPHPSKHVGKASTSNELAKQQNPNASAAVSCKACNRSFKSDQALQAHSKAKHGTAA